MNIGLDYDDTYTRDPDLWDAFIARATSQGRHKVYIITWRNDAEAESMEFSTAIRDRLAGVYATGRVAKAGYMFARGIDIHVWIDDNPRAILHTMQGHEHKEVV